MIPMWRLALAVSLLLCACSRRPDLPALPELRIETFQPSVRSEVEEAWASVKASPLDTAANGRLGMVLHAHEQFVRARCLAVAGVEQQAFPFDRNGCWKPRDRIH